MAIATKSLIKGPGIDVQFLVDADAWMLVVSTPGLFEEDYFLSVAEILNAAAGGPPDLAALLEVQARHGVTVVPG